jgi:hypothetical protein
MAEDGENPFSWTGASDLCHAPSLNPTTTPAPSQLQFAASASLIPVEPNP